MIALSTLCTLMCIAMMLFLYSYRRNNMVFEFRWELLTYAYPYFERLPSYGDMLYSIRPVRLSSYFTSAEMREIEEMKGQHGRHLAS